jgi:hypothetical protein
VQSNVTARIKALEVDLGCALFERHARGVSPTAAGQRLLPTPTGGRLLADARKAVRDDGVPRGLLTLTIGSLETTAALHLTPLLAGYAAEYPEVDLVLRTGTTRELTGEVLEGRVDGAPPGSTYVRTEVARSRLFSNQGNTNNLSAGRWHGAGTYGLSAMRLGPDPGPGLLACWRQEHSAPEARLAAPAAAHPASTMLGVPGGCSGRTAASAAEANLSRMASSSATRGLREKRSAAIGSA